MSFLSHGGYSLVSYFYKIIALENLFFLKTEYTLTGEECLTLGPPLR